MNLNPKEVRAVPPLAARSRPNEAVARSLTQPYFRAILGEDGRVTADGAHTALFGHKLADSALGRPDGIYAGWRWDGARLVIENDRYGFYPLFYCALPDRLLVSPSLPRLLTLGAPADFDEDGLAVFLRLGYFLGEDTPFQHLKALPPDCTFTWEAGRLEVSGRRAYYTREIAIGRDAAADDYIELFRAAIARRLPKGEAGVALSGGRDSRHILLELVRQGGRPVCVSVEDFPPRNSQDARIAGLLAHAAGGEHVVLPQRESQVSAEARKNWPANFCSDEHAHFMAAADFLNGRVGTAYDGIAGDVLSNYHFHAPERRRWFETRDPEFVANQLLDHSKKSEPGFNERALRYTLTDEAYRRFGRERAVARLSTEVRLHFDTVNPVDSYFFWNRTRREIALQPYGLLAGVPAVHSPFLDHALYDFLTSLPFAFMQTRDFHDLAIRRAYPAFAHIPFDDKHAPGLETTDHYARYGRELARRLLPRWPPRLMREPHLHLRLARGLVDHRYAAALQWFAPLALYLSELETLARGRVAVEFPAPNAVVRGRAA